jgi:thiosulfate/3-mercaptopyruvate sulfurtransferase
VPAQTPYPDRPSLAPSVDAGGVATRAPRRAVLDARSGERFRGEAEPIDPVAGHIPGARNSPFADNLHADGTFKTPDELRAMLGGVLDGVSPADTIVQCGSGVTACHTLLAMERAGLLGAKLYVGSWSEWCRHPDRAREPSR